MDNLISQEKVERALEEFKIQIEDAAAAVSQKDTTIQMTAMEKGWDSPEVKKLQDEMLALKKDFVYIKFEAVSGIKTVLKEINKIDWIGE